MCHPKRISFNGKSSVSLLFLQVIKTWAVGWYRKTKYDLPEKRGDGLRDVLQSRLSQLKLNYLAVAFRFQYLLSAAFPFSL